MSKTSDLWGSWVRLRDLAVNPCADCGKGVYQIRATLKNGWSVPIHRACGVDYEGILYIGEGNLCERVGYVTNAWKGDAKAHHQFTSTFTTYKRLDRIVDREFLEVRWYEIDDCKQEEARLIDEYVHKFGDLPPGNNRPGQASKVAGN